MPHPLPATTLREQALISRMSISLDDSEHSTRALRYVGTLLREARDVQVTLFHVLKPMPRSSWNMADPKIPQWRFAWTTRCSRIRRTGSVRNA